MYLVANHSLVLVCSSLTLLRLSHAVVLKRTAYTDSVIDASLSCNHDTPSNGSTFIPQSNASSTFPETSPSPSSSPNHVRLPDTCSVTGPLWRSLRLHQHGKFFADPLRQITGYLNMQSTVLGGCEVPALYVQLPASRGVALPWRLLPPHLLHL